MPAPGHLLDFRQRAHPLHAFYERALAKVHDMEDRYQMPYGLHSERLAAALTNAVAAYNIGKGPAERFGTLERVDLCGDGADRQVVAIDQRVNYHLPQVRVGMPVDRAVARSVEQSSQEWARRHMPHLNGAGPRKQPDVIAPTREALPDYDPRRPDNPRHALFEALRGKVAAAYAHAGIPRDPERLDEAAAAVLLHAQLGRSGGGRVQVSLLADPQTGVIGPDSDLLVQQRQGALASSTRIPVGELQAPPDSTFQRMAQAALHGQPGQAPQHAPVR